MPVNITVNKSVVLSTSDDRNLVIKDEKTKERIVIGPLNDETVEHLIYAAQRMKVFA